VSAALEAGYRHIDTAAAYGNERQVGEAVTASGLDRSEVFLETKIWISDYGYDLTLGGFAKSARKLGVDQIDLLVLHQALPSQFDATLEAYRALETLLADGKVRAIGVSNFMVDHLTRLLDRATVVPAVNQIEVHPYFAQGEVQALNAEHGILTQAWSRSAASPSTATASTPALCRTRPSATSRGRPIDEVKFDPRRLNSRPDHIRTVVGIGPVRRPR
jgi:diketogulonate reductase-like aldo/keto reductase